MLQFIIVIVMTPRDLHICPSFRLKASGHRKNMIFFLRQPNAMVLETNGACSHPISPTVLVTSAPRTIVMWLWHKVWSLTRDSRSPGVAKLFTLVDTTQSMGLDLVHSFGLLFQSGSRQRML